MSRVFYSILRWMIATRATQWMVAAGSIIAGTGYVLFPPTTTIGFFSGAWPPLVWGSAMLLGGLVKSYGLRSKVLDWQLLGLSLLFAGYLFLAAGQSMVMAGPPFAPTRIGGTAGYWVLVVIVLGRLAVVACDRQDGRIAQEQVDDEGR